MVLFPARRFAANGLEAWQQVVAAGYEGPLVGKDDASLYVGGRTPKWLKVKVPTARASGGGSRAMKGPSAPFPTRPTSIGTQVSDIVALIRHSDHPTSSRLP